MFHDPAERAEELSTKENLLVRGTEKAPVSNILKENNTRDKAAVQTQLNMVQRINCVIGIENRRVDKKISKLEKDVINMAGAASGNASALSDMALRIDAPIGIILCKKISQGVVGTAVEPTTTSVGAKKTVQKRVNPRKQDANVM